MPPHPATEPSLSSPIPYVFNTDGGRALCQQLVSKQLGYEPHSYQLDGVVRSLDKIDVLAITPTGSGKTGFLTMYLLVMHAIMKNPSLLPPDHRHPEHFRKDAGMVVTCPTKSLERNMEPKFHSAGLSTLVINQDTANAATLRGENIWKQAPNVHVLIIAPEQLSSKGFERLLADRNFQARIVAIGVDEVHLLNTWGQTFREAFKQIAPTQKRFDYNPILILLTATLRIGTPFNSVCAFMGLLPGHFHLIRRSNARYDIRFIFRTVQSSSYAFQFPELDWVLQEKRKVVIFCPTIRVGFRVAVYLREQRKAVVTVDEQIRMYNSLNWESYNSETLRFMQTDPHPRVTVATDTLSVGIDIANTQDVVLYDFSLPVNTDDILQKAGRIRDGRQSAGRAIIYLPRSAMETAQAICKAVGSTTIHESNPSPSTSKTNLKAAKVAATSDTVSVAQVIVAQCKIDALDALYGNPSDEVSCTCRGCIATPPISRSDPCNCSGCTPEDLLLNANSTTVPTLPAKRKRPPESKRVTKKMREHARERFHKFHADLREDRESCLTDMIPPEEILPGKIIESILDHLYDLTNASALGAIIDDHPHLKDTSSALLNLIEDLRQDFACMRAKAKAERKEAKQAAKEAETAAGGDGSGQSTETSSDEKEAGNVAGIALTIRIPGGRMKRD